MLIDEVFIIGGDSDDGVSTAEVRLTYKVYSSKKKLNRLFFYFGSGIFQSRSRKQIWFGGFDLWKRLHLSVTECRSLLRSDVTERDVQFKRGAITIADIPPESSTHSLVTSLRGQVGSEYSLKMESNK